MKVRYIAIYKLYGANQLPEEADSVDLLKLQNPTVSATLTTNPEPYFFHVDTSAALVAQIPKGLFAPKKERTARERLAAEIEEARASRAKQTGSGVFVVFEGEAEIPAPEFQVRRDTDEFAVVMNGIPKPEIRESFRPFIQSTLAALGLSRPADADRRVEKAGDVVYLVDPDNGNPIYSFTVIGGSARFSIASPLTRDVMAESATLAPNLAADDTMARPTSLLITSLDEATDELQGFIAAWSALEIFINATFKAAYAKRWFEIMEDGAPASAKPVFERFKDVMSDKYRLADKFLVIASVLDSDAASDDAAEFGRLKKIRDNLFHTIDTPPSPLPTDAAQKLLLKYMKLHLDARE